MKKRLILVLAFSVAVALSASLLVYRMIIGHLSAASRANVSRILTAGHDLPPGSVIRETDISYKETTTGEPGLRVEDVVGRGVLAAIYAGEPIAEARLTKKGTGGGLAAIIRPGMRAAAVRVNEVVGVSGFVTPGMRVDVITSGRSPQPGQRDLGTVTRTVLQNLQVLSAGSDMGRDSEGKPVAVQVVNVMVDPEQAEVLSLATGEAARVQLVLRNPLDNEIAKPPGTNAARMFAESLRPVVPRSSRFRKAPAVPLIPASAAKPEPERRPQTVELLSGAKRETVVLGLQGAEKR